MTIKELVEKLRKYPEEMEVYIYSEGCSEDIRHIDLESDKILLVKKRCWCNADD